MGRRRRRRRREIGLPGGLMGIDDPARTAAFWTMTDAAGCV